MLLILLLIPFIAFLLAAGLISAVTGTSFDNAVGLLVTIAVVVGLWVGGRRLLDGLRRWWAGRVRVDTLPPPVPPTRQIAGTARVAQQAMESAHDLAVAQQRVFRRAVEDIGADLDAAQDRHGSAKPGSGEFAGSKDIPFLLAAFARETVKNLGTTLLSTQQTAGRRLAEAVDRGVVVPDEELEDPPRRVLPAGEDEEDG